ncbi:MAG: tetratricopeptide repeat protein [Bacteroidetes bacterium]|nr:MAG: tetratricopeptide repeat protein [Bacteroidota bacterium]
MLEREFIAKGNALLELGRYEQALEQFRKAVTSDIDPALAYQQMAFCYLRLQNLKKAVLCANQALAHNPNCDYAFYVKANVKVLNNLAFAARQDILKAIELNPNVGFYYGTLADTYFIVKLWTLAIESAKTGLELDPLDVGCWGILIGAYHKTNDVENFEDAEKAALELLPNNELLHEIIGLAYYNRANIKKAKEHAQILLQINPSTKSPLPRAPEIRLIKQENPAYKEEIDPDVTKSEVSLILKIAIIVIGMIIYVNQCN